MTAVSLQNVEKRYGSVPVCRVDRLDISDGEVLTLLGPSGCGKTTTLRIIAGLVAQDSGELYFQAVDGSVMAARVTRDSIDQPVRLFSVEGALPEWGVAPDGNRFLFAIPATARSAPFGVILNWQSELR